MAKTGILVAAFACTLGLAGCSGGTDSNSDAKGSDAKGTAGHAGNSSGGLSSSGAASNDGGKAANIGGGGNGSTAVPSGGDSTANAGSGAISLEDPPPSGACGLIQPAFCDTFDGPSPGGRAGDLDDAYWSVARIATPGLKGVYDQWNPAPGEACGKTIDDVVPGTDIFMCAGGGTESMHMNDTEHDGGGFTIHSYRPRRLFDFTDRTGIIAFDAGAKGEIPGGHGIWFTIFITSEPVPAPYQAGGAIALFAKHGIGLEFSAGGGSIKCAADGTMNSISDVFIEEDYKIKKSYPYLFDQVEDSCFSTQDEVMNHLEIHLSQSTLEVYASDAGNPDSLRLILHLDDLGLPFSKGYVNFQQTHYNAAKSEVLPPYATYHWDNLGFDGPLYPTPRSYEVPDSMKSYQMDFGGGPVSFTEVGYVLDQEGMSDHDGAIDPITLHDVDLEGALDASLTLNAWGFCPGESIDYRLNGGTWRAFQCPFPLACGEGCGDGNTTLGTCNASARAVYIPVELADLKSGDNELEIRTSHAPDGSEVFIANAELSLNLGN